MTPKTKLQEEKRAAFRRFSKMGTTGLAVLSMSAFTNLSAQQLPDSVKFPKMQTDTLVTIDNEMINNEEDTITRYGNNHYYAYSNYCNYYNYGNYSNNNNYGNYYADSNYNNNYTNYSNSNYSNTNFYTDGI